MDILTNNIPTWIIIIITIFQGAVITWVTVIAQHAKDRKNAFVEIKKALTSLLVRTSFIVLFSANLVLLIYHIVVCDNPPSKMSILVIIFNTFTLYNFILWGTLRVLHNAIFDAIYAAAGINKKH